ncbi:MAG TPA: peptide chain release factor N(5)-glutamine methyltransferase [Sporichthyaceae bacterium]|jgi:release factor glutamine methyltransferase
MAEPALTQDVRAAIERATSRLAAAGVGSPRFDAEELAAHVLGIARADLVRHDRIDADTYEALIAARELRRPLQHLTGLAHFRYLSVAVGPGVFVPRPETEVMVDQVIDHLRAGPAEPLVVDLCTGSGAVALSIATEVPGARVHAVEVDPIAHDWAARNLAGSGVILHLADARTALPELDGTVDVVISNPPYIPLQAWESVATEVRDHDPAAALWGGGEDGLDLIRGVEARAALLLRRDGLVAVEHADVQRVGVTAVFGGSGRWRAVADHQDLAGRDRYLTALRV